MTPKVPKTNSNQGKCMKCNKLPNASKTSAICDCCKNLLCGDCHGLSPTEVRVLELKTLPRTMTFMCPDCKNSMTQLPLIMKKLNELTEEVKQLRVRQSMLATESAIQEMTERANRSANLIIYDVPESTSDVPDVRKEDDKRACSSVIGTITNKINCNGIKTFRLGAPKSQPRPLKVILRTKSDAVEVLRNRHRLSRPSSVKADLTPMQREYLKHLREELEKRISEGEIDLTIKYVRGQPTIVKTQARASPKN